MIEILGWIALSVAIGSTFRGTKSSAGLDWKWWLLTATVLVLFRWPNLWLPHELYPDESQLLAGARTLRHDPLFWRSVDGATAGPLDFFILVPATFGGGAASYGWARVTALVLVWITINLSSETLALLGCRVSARAAVIPFLVFESFTTSAEFIHCATELLPACLVATTFYLLIRQSLKPSIRTLLWAGVLVGAIPFSKLQAVPVAAALGGCLAFQEFRAGRKRNLLRLGVALAIPTFLLVGPVVAAGELRNLVIPYLLQNFQYIDAGKMGIKQVLVSLADQSVSNGYPATWLAGAVIFLVAAPFLTGPQTITSRRLGTYSFLILMVAVICVLTPGRPYHHYLNLVFVPLTLLVGTSLSSRSPEVGNFSPRRFTTPLMLLSCVALQLFQRAKGAPDPYAAYNQVAPSQVHQQLSALIRTYTERGEALGVWGWRTSLYVESDLHQATRQAHTETQIVQGPWQPYFLATYLDDFRAANPPVWVDAVGPGNFQITDRRWAHEAFPALQAWVQTHYALAADLDGARVYVRNDRWASNHATKRPTAP